MYSTLKLNFKTHFFFRFLSYQEDLKLWKKVEQRVGVCGIV